MLARKTGRRLHRDVSRALRPSLEQLQLPWLCPAFFETSYQRQSLRRSATSISRSSSPASGQLSHSPRRPNPLAPQSTNARGFATPVAVDLHDEYIPFEAHKNPLSMNNEQYPWRSRDNPSEIVAFDPESIHKLPDEINESARNFSGGSIPDMHAILAAYLDVGQLEQASLMIRRLHKIYNVDQPELQTAHLAYIATVVSNIMITADPNLTQHMWQWFNEDVRAKGVTISPTMIRLLIQASLKQTNRKKSERYIRRYLHAAKRENILEDSVEELSRFLTEDEFRQLREVSPEYFSSFSSESEPLVAGPAVAEPDAVEPVQATDSMPAILAQDQKGLGLTSLRKSLGVFAENVSGPIQAALTTKASLAYTQERLERDTLQYSLERWRLDHEETMRRSGTHSGLHTMYMGSLLWKWHKSLTPRIEEELRMIKNEGLDSSISTNNTRIAYGPFMQYIPAEKLSAITILQTVQSLATADLTKGFPVPLLVDLVGGGVEDESSAEMLKSRMKQWSAKNVPARMRRRELAYLAEKHKPTSEAPTTFSNLPEWTPWIRAQIGSTLVSMLIEIARIEAPNSEKISNPEELYVQPAFSKILVFKEGLKHNMLLLHPYLAEKIKLEPAGSAIANHLPMVTKPIPWTGYRDGGYMSYPVPVVRLDNATAQPKKYIKLASESGDMKQIFRALDILGQVPWKINRPVFDVMLQAWNSGEAIANIPPRDHKPEYPPEPERYTDTVAWARWKALQKMAENERDGFHSDRCFQNFQLEVARAFVDQTMYFPHNMDFRGRAYPIPPYLNHMSADNCRGLLMFAEAKPLGENGLRWLRIHLANVFGFDKASLDERSDFTVAHWEDICDSATHPMNGRRWWLEAEDPWQCLAACMELKNALESPCPKTYKSHLPVHQDGTCNGLQHYAALGGDSVGAKQVNLEPSDRPADIYSAVARSVAELVREDASSGHTYAKMLDGKINRKIVKQSVMTNVYGVTFVGARTQVKARLDEIYPDLFKQDPLGSYNAAGYIATYVFKALSAMFNVAHDIQYWFGECGTRICDSLSPAQLKYIEKEAGTVDVNKQYKKRPLNTRETLDENMRFKTGIVWTTPLKMPVVQPYWERKTKTLKTNFQSFQVKQSTTGSPVYRRRQLQGFPPNFIHSLDATHMFLSALKCDEMGLTFAAVHDSYWTHPGDVDSMNSALRDAFICIHSEDIMGRLAAEFKARYEGHMYLVSVSRTSAVGRKIAPLMKKKNARRKDGKPARISYGRIDDLLEEKRRQELLASENPSLRAEGEAMITPAKIYDEMIANGEVQEVKAAGDKLKHEEALIGKADAECCLQTPGEESVLSQSNENGLKLYDVVKNQNDKPKKQVFVAKFYFWRKMSFPPLPKKGDFDVSRTRNSTYFFS